MVFNRIDVIHTDGGLLGIPWSLGHVDFYPNNGVALQPGCVQEELSKNNFLGIIGKFFSRFYSIHPPFFPFDLVGCSHIRAWQYFVESIRRPEAFLADRCEYTNNESKECLQSVEAYMGLKSSPRLRGKYYLTTNSVTPFGRNFPIWKSVHNFIKLTLFVCLSLEKDFQIKNHKKKNWNLESLVLDLSQIVRVGNCQEFKIHENCWK